LGGRVARAACGNTDVDAASTFTNATLPLIFLILAWVIDKKRPGMKWLLLGLMGLGGVILLLNPSADLDPIGVLCMLSATTLIAFSSRWMQKWDVGDFLVLTAWQLFLGGLMLIPLAWFMAGPPQLPSLTVAGIGVILLSLLLMKLPQNLRLNPFKKVQP